MNAELPTAFPDAAYIDPTARVYGKVEIGEAASLWPYTVIRAESSSCASAASPTCRTT